MKTKLLTIFLLLIGLLATGVTAGFFPQPMVGQVSLVDFPIPEGLQVEYKNLNSQEVYYRSVDSTGFHQFDWANTNFRNGDSVQVSLVACKSNPSCVRTLTLVEGVPNVGVDFSLSGAVQDDVVKDIFKYACRDGSVVNNPGDCPVVDGDEGDPTPILESKVYVCRDGSERVSAEDCPLDLPVGYSVIVGAMAIVILGMAALWTYYSNKGADLRAKYRWIPGMKGILQSKLDLYIQLAQSGEKAEATKLGKTLQKYSETLTNKYLKQLLEEEE